MARVGRPGVLFAGLVTREFRAGRFNGFQFGGPEAARGGFYFAGLILSFGLTRHVLASIGGAMNFGAMSKIVDCGVSMATWGL
jgi:hypothetical protein